MKRTDRRRYQPKRRKVKRRKAGLIKPKWRLRLNWEYLPVVAKWVFEIAVVCLFAFVAVWYFGQRVSTVGDSMSPVLRNGDVVLVNRIVYNATTPKRGM